MLIFEQVQVNPVVKTLSLAFLSLLISLASFGQVRFPSLSDADSVALVAELTAIKVQDQRYRQLLTRSTLPQPAGYRETLTAQMQAADADNQRRLDSLVALYGYPGLSLVGRPLCDVGWFVIHHSSPEYMTKYRAVLIAYSEWGELDTNLVRVVEKRHQRIAEGRLRGYADRATDTTHLAYAVIQWAMQHRQASDDSVAQAGLRARLDSLLTTVGYPGTRQVGDSLAHYPLSLMLSLGFDEVEAHAEALCEACSTGEIPEAYCLALLNAWYWQHHRTLAFGAPPTIIPTVPAPITTDCLPRQ